jgi:hypothetical protein
MSLAGLFVSRLQQRHGLPVPTGGGVGINTDVITSVGDLDLHARANGDADSDLVLVSRSGQFAEVYVSDANGALGFIAGARFTGLYPTCDTRLAFDTAPVAGRYINTTANGAFLSTGGVWTNASSVKFKEDFAPVDPQLMLDRVLALPIQQWRYRAAEDGLHVGPTAEDFSAAFGLGGVSEHIGTVDADGVALAAIQGLATRLHGETVALRARLAAVEKRLAKRR